jgi:hypothetical protein
MMKLILQIKQSILSHNLLILNKTPPTNSDRCFRLLIEYLSFPRLDYKYDREYKNQ